MTGTINGTRAVLEVRSHEVPFILEDGQVVASLVFERLLERPRALYGEGIGSNYQRQGLKLSKHFRMRRCSRLMFDVVGVGLNATDTLLVVPHFPAYGGKVPFLSETYSPGGQVATAMVACAKLGLRAKYIGTIGDDERGRIQMESLRSSGINLDHVQQRHNCPNQSAYIIIDQSTGERTVFWSRPDCLRIAPGRDRSRSRSPAPGCCTSTATIPRPWSMPRASRAPRGIPVTVDVDTIYPGFDSVLPLVDYLIASSEFPGRWTRIEDPFDGARSDSAGIRHAGGGDDAGRARSAGAGRRPVFLFAGLRGELRRYHRRRRRVSRGVLLCCVAEDASRRSAGILQRHGRPELHRNGRARRISRPSTKCGA